MRQQSGVQFPFGYGLTYQSDVNQWRHFLKIPAWPRPMGHLTVIIMARGASKSAV